jgi:predicted RNA binding protein YcfA (HicA-like mRNA interferase family)
MNMIGYKFRDFKRILEANGFVYARTSGDHVLLKRGGEHISVPYKSKGEISRPMTKRFIKEYNLDVNKG